MPAPGVPAAERLIVNEIAPRVHNSGHWTIDACAVSQFENHMRAVAGWPLGTTERHSNAEMVNLIGKDALAWRELAAEPGACVHLYGKREARDGPQDGPRHPPVAEDLSAAAIPGFRARPAVVSSSTAEGRPAAARPSSALRRAQGGVEQAVASAAQTRLALVLLDRPGQQS